MVPSNAKLFLMTNPNEVILTFLMSRPVSMAGGPDNKSNMQALCPAFTIFYFAFLTA
uniref:Uncharacterized protein n=1 Tax=viral metagenome TaxID=1070528 RepID=A0A6C0J2L1_9ZZZZ